jgi:hypothetical protein
LRKLMLRPSVPVDFAGWLRLSNQISCFAPSICFGFYHSDESKFMTVRYHFPAISIRKGEVASNFYPFYALRYS